eukprot:g19912.t1
MDVTLLDYGAGNVKSVFNAIQSLGYKVPLKGFPGAKDSVLHLAEQLGAPRLPARALQVHFVETPEDILKAERLIFPGVGAFGACVDALQRKGFMEPLRQYLKEDRPFFGICLGMQTLFEGSEESPGVPGLGLSGVAPMRLEPWPLEKDQPRCYFVHSYRVPMPEGAAPWALACSEYGETFVCAVRQGRCVATQFHPEKSGTAGLKILQSWLQGSAPSGAAAEAPAAAPAMPAVPARRIIACLDVRRPGCRGERYYQDGADEVSFLNITAFRDMVLTDQPMLEVLRLSAERIFVPLTVGGGIRSYVDAKGQSYSALEVADAYFRAGADKISIGSDAVEVARAFYAAGRKGDGSSSIELISTKYDSELDVVQLAQAVEALGAGELLLNCIDRDGQGTGYELELINQVKTACTLPVIASSGAGTPEHFEEALATGADAALAAGIFHREEVPIQKVKGYLTTTSIPVRS